VAILGFRGTIIERCRGGLRDGRRDDWIAERAKKSDIVITSDIPLASRCVKAGAEVMRRTASRLLNNRSA